MRRSSGSVYVDVNANGRLDADEPGVPGVLVSDGLHVVASDAGGRYRLDGRDDRTLLRITSPRDHAVVGHFWRWVDGQREEDFGLVRQEQPEDFLFLHISDTHIGREDLLREFAGRVVKLPVPIAFVVNTGDLGPGLDGLVPEKASLAAYLRGVAPLAVPLYHAAGQPRSRGDQQRERRSGRSAFRHRLLRTGPRPGMALLGLGGHPLHRPGRHLPRRRPGKAERVGPGAIDLVAIRFGPAAPRAATGIVHPSIASPIWRTRRN